MNKRPEHTQRAFSMIEVLVASAVLAMMLALIFQVTGQTGATLRRVTGQVDAFQASRLAFEDLSRNLAQATLNTYWDYQRDDSGRPTAYKRKSDLHFLVLPPTAPKSGFFFQAPLSYLTTFPVEPAGVLNAAGYWVEFGIDSAFLPPHVGSERSRYRLMQAVQPGESLAVMTSSSDEWVTGLRAMGRPLADNVIALLAIPKWSVAEGAVGTSLSTDFSYDSRTGSGDQSAQLPPVMQVTMIAMDESSAVRLGDSLEPTITSVLAGRFESVDDFEKDLAYVREALSGANIAYQVFSSAISLRESKWSKTRP